MSKADDLIEELLAVLTKGCEVEHVQRAERLRGLLPRKPKRRPGRPSLDEMDFDELWPRVQAIREVRRLHSSGTPLEEAFEVVSSQKDWSAGAIRKWYYGAPATVFDSLPSRFANWKIQNLPPSDVPCIILTVHNTPAGELNPEIEDFIRLLRNSS